MKPYPNAIQRPGPFAKTGYSGQAAAAKDTLFLHSAVGGEAAMLAVLDGPVNSWHFSVMQDGRVLQHYDVLAICYHAGVKAWNIRGVGIEHEGGPLGNESEPLTPPQLAASIALVRWLCSELGLPVERVATLREHNEVTATACPSGRIPWGRYLEEDGMDGDLKRLAQLVLAGAEHADEAERERRVRAALDGPLATSLADQVVSAARVLFGDVDWADPAAAARVQAWTDDVIGRGGLLAVLEGAKLATMQVEIDALKARLDAP